MVIPVIAIMYFFMFGLSFFLSAVTVFLRDIAIVLSNILMIISFGTPIFYTLESMSAPIQFSAVANPFYILTEGFRQPLVYHAIPNSLLYGLIYILVLSFALYFLGLSRFKKVKGYFTSVK